MIQHCEEGSSAAENDRILKEQVRILENDELIIEENTIYEIDLNCYECLMKAKQLQEGIQQ